MPVASTRNRLTTEGYRPPPKSWKEIMKEQEGQDSISRKSSIQSNAMIREQHLTSLNSFRKKVLYKIFVIIRYISILHMYIFMTKTQRVY